MQIIPSGEPCRGNEIDQANSFQQMRHSRERFFDSFNAPLSKRSWIMIRFRIFPKKRTLSVNILSKGLKCRQLHRSALSQSQWPRINWLFKKRHSSENMKRFSGVGGEVKHRNREIVAYVWIIYGTQKLCYKWKSSRHVNK